MKSLKFHIFLKLALKLLILPSHLDPPSSIYVGIFTHDLKSTVRPSLSFQINLIAMTHGRGDAAPAPDSAQQLQLYLAPASKNRCEVLGGELIFISTQRELWTQTLKQATNDDWQGGIFTARK